MSHNHCVIIAIFFAIFLFSSCTEEIPLEIESEEEVVVNCLLTTDSVQELTLTYSKSLDGGIYSSGVDSATVTLYQDDHEIGEFVKSGSTTWKLTYSAVLGKKYNLKIDIPGEDEITASTTMPSASNLSVVSDTIESENQYINIFEQKKQYNNQWIFCLNAADDSSFLVNPLDTPSVSTSDVLLESIGTDHPNTDLFNQEGTLSDILGDDAQFPAYNYYIRLISDSTSDITFGIEAAFDSFHFVVFRNSSDEYDKYLKTSLQKMFLYIDEDDVVQWFDEDEVYTNINNGVGIFGAYYDQEFYFSPVTIDEQP